MGVGISYAQIQSTRLNEFLKYFNQEDNIGQVIEFLEYFPAKEDIINQAVVGKIFGTYQRLLERTEDNNGRNRRKLIMKGLYGYVRSEISIASYIDHPIIEEFNQLLIDSKLASRKRFLEAFARDYEKNYRNVDVEMLVEEYQKDETVNWTENLEEIREGNIGSSNFRIRISTYERFRSQLEAYFRIYLEFHEFYGKCSSNKDSWILMSIG
ncbi:MAG: hypothetical protein J7F05_08925 [Trichodesmium erythraeum GBRTRLIN201]|nr:hypothetical protein [Trichodesmium erythraeum GBRTRLIN201]